MSALRRSVSVLQSFEAVCTSSASVSAMSVFLRNSVPEEFHKALPDRSLLPGVDVNGTTSRLLHVVRSRAAALPPAGKLCPRGASSLDARHRRPDS